MSYNYLEQRRNIFTEDGQNTFIKIRDNAQRLLKEAGAFRATEVMSQVCGDSWVMMACLDRMIELGEIVEVHRNCWSQYKIYSTPEVSKR